MVTFRRDSSCERARAWASLEVDGELSQLERRQLRAHLRACADCAAAAAEMRSLAELLRAAPVERPTQSFAPTVPRRSRRRVSATLAFRLVAAAAVTVFAASLGVVAGTLGHSSANAPKAPSSDVALLVPQANADRERPRLAKPAPSPERLFPPGRLGGV